MSVTLRVSSCAEKLDGQHSPSDTVSTIMKSLWVMYKCVSHSTLEGHIEINRFPPNFHPKQSLHSKFRLVILAFGHKENMFHKVRMHYAEEMGFKFRFPVFISKFLII